MKKNNLLSISVLITTLLIGQAAFADMRPMSNNELGQIVAGNPLDNVIILNHDLKAYLQERNGEVNANEIKDFLQNHAHTLGLSLDDFTIRGLSYGDVPLEIQLDGTRMATLQLPAYIDQIHIGAIKVNSDNPNNKSFGSIDIRGIDLSGTKINVNFSTTAFPH
jgi:hypothetical protein